MNERLDESSSERIEELGEGEQLEADADDDDEDDDDEEFDISSRFNVSVVFKTSLLLFSYVLIGGSFRDFREGFFGGDDDDAWVDFMMLKNFSSS